MSFIRFYFIIAANHITKSICFLFSCWHCICSYKFIFVILAGLFGLLGNSKENIFKNMFFLRNQKTKKKRTRALWTRRLPRLTFANKLNAIPMLRQQFSQNLFSATDCCRLKCCSRESKRKWDCVSSLLHHSQRIESPCIEEQEISSIGNEETSNTSGSNINNKSITKPSVVFGHHYDDIDALRTMMMLLLVLWLRCILPDSHKVLAENADMDNCCCVGWLVGWWHEYMYMCLCIQQHGRLSFPCSCCCLSWWHVICAGVLLLFENIRLDILYTWILRYAYI